MTFLIISHTFHYQKGSQIKAYAPYVREMNLWLQYVNEVDIIAPKIKVIDDNIMLAYQHQHMTLIEVPSFSLLGLKAILSTLKLLPSILNIIYEGMKKADHIHLRCPGNMGLLGCLVQILFPSKPKTAKYAGNWDPKSIQPWSYKLQKWILSNTILTKNMSALVYGKWPNQTKNIKSFFTASYFQSEIEPLYIRNYTKTLHFCFVGSLSVGKQPGQALKFVDRLRQLGKESVLHFYGDGEMSIDLENKIQQYDARDWAFMYGNQPKEQIKKALQYSHFLILPSRSEGWPKAVAEAMFWGCIPIASKVSCVPWMLDYGERGFIINKNITENNIIDFHKSLEDLKVLEEKSKKATEWARQFTLDKFRENIAALV